RTPRVHPMHHDVVEDYLFRPVARTDKVQAEGEHHGYRGRSYPSPFQMPKPAQQCEIPDPNDEDVNRRPSQEPTQTRKTERKRQQSSQRVHVREFHHITRVAAFFPIFPSKPTAQLLALQTCNPVQLAAPYTNWSVAGATPVRCQETFVRAFVFQQHYCAARAKVFLDGHSLFHSQSGQLTCGHHDLCRGIVQISTAWCLQCNEFQALILG